MWTFSIFSALALLARTGPFLLFRIGVYLGIAVAITGMTWAGAGIGYALSALGSADVRAATTFWGGAAGFGLTAALVYFVRDFLLHGVRAGHIAVMVARLDAEPMPEGQLAHARHVIADRFGDPADLFRLDQLLQGVTGPVTGLLEGPGQTSDTSRVIATLRVSFGLASGLIDKAILGHAIRWGTGNAWEAAQDGLVLYAQNSRPILSTAAWLTFFTWGLTILIFLVMLGPAAAVIWLLPGESAAGTVVFAGLFSWAIKEALLEPFAIAGMLPAFITATEGQRPSGEWAGRLTRASGTFRDLGERAQHWGRRVKL